MLSAVLTRPIALHTPWRGALEVAGIPLADYPLSEFKQLDTSGLAAQIAAAAAVVVISPSAAQAAGAALMVARRVYAPGPGTDAAIRYQGYSGFVNGYAQDTQYFDAENMLRHLQLDVTTHGLAQGVLVLRGELHAGAKDEVAAQLAALGVPAQVRALYRNQSLAFSAERAAQLERLLRQPQVWLLAQTRAVTWLAQEAAQLRTSPFAQQRCVAIHPRIAAAATAAGFARVISCTPDTEALLEAVKSVCE